LFATSLYEESFIQQQRYSLPSSINEPNIMKKVLSILAITTLALGSAYAGCGKVVTNEGKLKEFDAATKTVVVEGTDGKTAKLTLTPSSKGAEKADKLVGKDVKVDSEHGKITSIAKA
jgi:hypothetical protein